MVEEKLAFPKSLGEYFDSAHSPLNPYNRGNDTFVYGTFPIFLTKAVAGALHRDGYDGAYLVGRALSAFFDLLTVWLVYRLCRRFAGRNDVPRRGEPPRLLSARDPAFPLLGGGHVPRDLRDAARCSVAFASRAGARVPGATRGRASRSGSPSPARSRRSRSSRPVGVALLLRLDAERRAARRAPPRARFAAPSSTGAIRSPPRSSRSGWRCPTRSSGGSGGSTRATSGTSSSSPPSRRALPDFRRRSSGPAARCLFPVQNFVLWGAAPFFGLTALAALVWTLVRACAAGSAATSLPLAGLRGLRRRRTTA